MTAQRRENKHECRCNQYWIIPPPAELSNSSHVSAAANGGDPDTGMVEQNQGEEK